MQCDHFTSVRVSYALFVMIQLMDATVVPAKSDSEVIFC